MQVSSCHLPIPFQISSPWLTELPGTKHWILAARRALCGSPELCGWFCRPRLCRTLSVATCWLPPCPSTAPTAQESNPTGINPGGHHRDPNCLHLQHGSIFPNPRAEDGFRPVVYEPRGCRATDQPVAQHTSLQDRRAQRSKPLARCNEEFDFPSRGTRRIAACRREARPASLLIPSHQHPIHHSSRRPRGWLCTTTSCKLRAGNLQRGDPAAAPLSTGVPGCARPCPQRAGRAPRWHSRLGPVQGTRSPSGPDPPTPSATGGAARGRPAPRGARGGSRGAPPAARRPWGALPGAAPQRGGSGAGAGAGGPGRAPGVAPGAAPPPALVAAPRAVAWGTQR